MAMKKALLFAFYALLALFLAFIAIGYALPDKAHVERETVIHAPPEKVFGIVSDLNRAKEWGPWFELDPAMKLSVEGPAGAGQKMSWDSNNPNVGKGSQTTTELVVNEKVVAALDFGEMGKAETALTLAPEGQDTKVAWSFDTGLDGVFERWFGLMFDSWIGADYEKGLARLKALAEKP